MTTATNAIDQVKARDGRLSEVVSLAKSSCFEIAKARKAMRPDMAQLIQPTIDAWKRELRPLRMVEPNLNGSEARKVKRAFLPNAAKMRPDMAEEKAEVWCGSVCAALSDLPVRFILKGMDEALHKVFEFPTQLEAHIRTRAEAHLELELQYIAFLRRLYASLYGEQQPLQLEEKTEPLSEGEVRRLLHAPLGKTVLSLGISAGHIDPDLVARLRAEEGMDETP